MKFIGLAEIAEQSWQQICQSRSWKSDVLSNGSGLKMILIGLLEQWLKTHCYSRCS